MFPVYSEVIQFRGNHYDFGHMQGKLLINSKLLSNRYKQWFSRPTNRFYVNSAEYKKIIKQIIPEIWDEIIGLQEALEVSLDEAVKMFGGYYVEFVRSGCSIFIHDDYMIRNYDNDPLSYEGRFVLFSPTDRGLATIGPSMQITGRTDGMNEKGLVMGYNFINTKRSADGFVCNMIGRILLQSCATVDEAFQLLKEIPHRHSFSYALLDITGKSVVVEASPRQVVQHDAKICTNHFQILTEENRYRMDDSLRRFSEMEKKKETINHPFHAFKMMNDMNGGVFSTNYGAWSGTIHTALYDVKNMQAGYAIGGNRLPYIIHFNDWLQGKQLNVKKINGKLQTKIPFANMFKL